MTSKSAASLPSIRVTTPFSTTSSGSGSFGPFIATRPSSGAGVISISRRSSFSARDAKRADPSDTAEPPCRICDRSLADEGSGERRVPVVEPERPLLELGGPLEVVRQLAPPRPPGHRRLTPQRGRGGANVGRDERAGAGRFERHL